MRARPSLQLLGVAVCIVLTATVAMAAPSRSIHPAVMPQTEESPEPSPTAEPTDEPSAEPSPEPTATDEPTPGPTATEEPTGQPSSNESTTSEPSDGNGTADQPSTWQWVLLGALAVGALAVVALARKRGPDPEAARENRRILLAQLQQLATRAETTAPTDEELAYLSGVVRSLAPVASDAARTAPDPESRDRLTGVESALGDLRTALKDAKGSPRKGPERDAVPRIATILGERVTAARTGGSEGPG